MGLGGWVWEGDWRSRGYIVYLELHCGCIAVSNIRTALWLYSSIEYNIVKQLSSS